MVTTIYLVRHAEAIGNIDETFQGRTDTPVTEKGRKQLDYLAERFRDIPITALYASPMSRTRETAAAVNRHHRLPVVYRDDLMEIDGGAWERKSWREIPVLFPEAYDNWQTRMGEFEAPMGETMWQVFSRMQKAVGEIAEAHPGETLAVVSHGCAIRNFLCFAAGDPISGLCNVGWGDNTAVSCVTYDAQHRTHLVFKNDASHLPKELSTLASSKWCRYETDTFHTDVSYVPTKEGEA